MASSYGNLCENREKKRHVLQQRQVLQSTGMRWVEKVEKVLLLLLLLLLWGQRPEVN
jgi:hypothetical protein